ncbi:hypothetical protein [Cerasicoccus frondis]|uniref:hypothetical protein n=1 Tax=Cerasicoccus frondis TaxID=490090 RepID=UPI0028527A63|nr:hypothetical protein [Cerasicoccus frondis]
MGALTIADKRELKKLIKNSISEVQLVEPKWIRGSRAAGARIGMCDVAGRAFENWAKANGITCNRIGREKYWPIDEIDAAMERGREGKECA